MIDASRLEFADNVRVTAEVVALAHPVPVEAELGAVLGHEAGPLPPYEELFATGRGFTDVAQAAQFVAETGVDWLSVAIGNVHGAVQGRGEGRRQDLGPAEPAAAEADRRAHLHPTGPAWRLGTARGRGARGLPAVGSPRSTSARRSGRPTSGRSASTAWWARAQEAVAQVVTRHLEDYAIVDSADQLG